MEMNRILNIDLNRLEISENEIENVIGKVNEEMKLDGWILMELKNEECLIVNIESEEEYLLNKQRWLHVCMTRGKLRKYLRRFLRLR